jgi:hypothetical protein
MAKTLENLEEKRVSAVLRDDHHLHSTFVALDLVVQNGTEIVKEGLALLSGYETADGVYELHYEWQGKSRDRFVRVADGQLNEVVKAGSYPLNSLTVV